MKKIVMGLLATLVLVSGLTASVFAMLGDSDANASATTSAGDFIFVADDVKVADGDAAKIAPGETIGCGVFGVLNYTGSSVSQYDINVNFAFSLSSDSTTFAQRLNFTIYNVSTADVYYESGYKLNESGEYVYYTLKNQLLLPALVKTKQNLGVKCLWVDDEDSDSQVGNIGKSLTWKITLFATTSN